jgi:2-oxoisovalerate dehydrogenase E2 component (dihydrolipoyl transacylase)
MTTFNLPDLGEGLQDAEIVAWHVSEGDHVVADEPLVSVETEKAVVEVPSPRSGYVKRLLAGVHERVKVGGPLVEFDEAAHADTGTVVGELGELGKLGAAAGTAGAMKATEARVPEEARVLASPAVRALARGRGIDLAGIRGSGPGGTITRADLERAAPGAARAGKPGEAVALKGIRRTMAINMARARAEIVPATVWDDADIGNWWRVDAGVTVRLVRAIACGCKAAPILNSWFDAAAMTLRTFERIDLGIAVDFEGGLSVPVIRDAGGLSPAALRGEIDRLKEAARARSVSVADLRDPTITLSNFGMLAGRRAALVVMPPQVAIIGAGRIFQQSVPREGPYVFTHLLPLSITFDHRVVTGGEVGRFLRAMIDDLMVDDLQKGE